MACAPTMTAHVWGSATRVTRLRVPSFFEQSRKDYFGRLSSSSSRRVVWGSPGVAQKRLQAQCIYRQPRAIAVYL